MNRSTAEVTTDTPERFAKQLASHLGHRVPVTEDGGTARFAFGAGTGIVSSGEGVLHLVAEAPDDDSLAQVEDVLARHLVRFGERQGLTVDWSRDTGDELPA